MYPGWSDACNGSPVVAHTANLSDKLLAKTASKHPFTMSLEPRPVYQEPFNKPSSHTKLPHPAPPKWLATA
jgi:hypothetical protein